MIRVINVNSLNVSSANGLCRWRKICEILNMSPFAWITTPYIGLNAIHVFTLWRFILKNIWFFMTEQNRSTVSDGDSSKIYWHVMVCVKGVDQLSFSPNENDGIFKWAKEWLHHICMYIFSCICMYIFYACQFWLLKNASK